MKRTFIYIISVIILFLGGFLVSSLLGNPIDSNTETYLETTLLEKDDTITTQTESSFEEDLCLFLGCQYEHKFKTSSANEFWASLMEMKPDKLQVQETNSDETVVKEIYIPMNNQQVLRASARFIEGNDIGGLMLSKIDIGFESHDDEFFMWSYKSGSSYGKINLVNNLDEYYLHSPGYEQSRKMKDVSRAELRVLNKGGVIEKKVVDVPPFSDMLNDDTDVSLSFSGLSGLGGIAFTIGYHDSGLTQTLNGYPVSESECVENTCEEDLFVSIQADTYQYDGESINLLYSAVSP